MNRVRTAAVVGSLAVAMTAWAVSPAVAQGKSPQDLKKLMGENFAGLQASTATADPTL